MVESLSQTSETLIFVSVLEPAEFVGDVVELCAFMTQKEKQNTNWICTLICEKGSTKWNSKHTDFIYVANEDDNLHNMNNNNINFMEEKLAKIFADEIWNRLILKIWR